MLTLLVPGAGELRERSLVCVLTFTILILATTASDTQNLTTLFHEALAGDGSLQSTVGVNGQLADLELVYLRRHPTPPNPASTQPQPNFIFNIPTKRHPPAAPLFYSFTAFRRRYRLRLKPMSHLVSPKAQLMVMGGSDMPIPTPFMPELCHYTHVDEDITAALSVCKPDTLKGYVVSRNTTLEVRPLRGVAAQAVTHAITKRGGSRYLTQGVPHLVRRVPRTTPTRPKPAIKDLEIPPPTCKEPIGNAIPDEIEFDQGEIFTVPPQAWTVTTPMTAAPTTSGRPSPRPEGGPPKTDFVEQPHVEVPERPFLPTPEVLKRSLEVEMSKLISTPIPDTEAIKRTRWGDARPIMHPFSHTGQAGGGEERRRRDGSNREPRPTKGINRDPKPIIFTNDPPSGQAGGGEERRRRDGSNREPRPTKGINRDPKPIIFTTNPPSAAATIPDPDSSQHLLHQVKKRSQSKTIELGVFVDQAAYDLFFPYLGSLDALMEFILGYVNGIQALFHHPTLGQKIQLVINYIELMDKQPAQLLHFGGDREKLYDSFRLYNKEKNEQAVNMVNGLPWDIGILISGHNFYSMKTKTKKPSYSTMGLAAVRGVCHPDYSAVIVELGVTDTWGKPYPTAGFASIYVMAHEIGHNLGMLHDGYNNSCPRNGYVMSASRSTSGETNWSSCSRKVLETLNVPCLGKVTGEARDHDHTKYMQLPGQTWDAYDQCRIFLRDQEATLYNETLDQSVCNTVMCRSPNRIGYFKAGPALDGTYCSDNRWCIAGSCTPWSPEKAPVVVEGGWGPWHHTPCTSGCLINALGIQVSKRNCSNPKPRNTVVRCPGVSTILNTCDDKEVCQGNRISVHQYADNKCTEFSTVVKDLKHIGAQAPHNPDRQWQACAIFCQRTSGTWYSPRTDLSYLPHFDTYFPDGTPCHKEGGKQFYCQRHQCLPLGQRMAKKLENPNPEWDVHVYQNAPPQPSNNTVPVQVARIFELSENMDPLQSEPLDLYHEEDEHLWVDFDYLHP